MHVYVKFLSLTNKGMSFNIRKYLLYDLIKILSHSIIMMNGKTKSQEAKTFSFLLNKKIYFTLNYACLCLCMYMQVHWEATSFNSPGAGTTGHCESPDMDAGN